MRDMSCPVCQSKVSLEPKRHPKRDEPYLMMVCVKSGSHFRAFINDQGFIARMIKEIEGLSDDAA